MAHALNDFVFVSKAKWSGEDEAEADEDNRFEGVVVSLE